MVFHEITPEAIQHAIDEPPRDRPPAGRRPGGPAHPRPPLRLRGQPRPLEEGAAAACRPAGCRAWPPASSSSGSGSACASGRPRTGTSTAAFAGGEPQDRRSRATPGRRRRRPPGHGQGLRPRTGAVAAATSSSSTRPGPGAWPTALDRADFAVRSVESKPYTRKPYAAVHDLDPPAGGGAQAALLVGPDDARRPAALRERLHHLHAHRQHDAVGHRGRRRPGPDPGAVRRGVPARRPAAVHQQGQERPGGPRGHPPRRRPLPHPRGGRRRAQRRPSTASTS